jgi:hypothetical protein
MLWDRHDAGLPKTVQFNHSLPVQAFGDEIWNTVLIRANRLEGFLEFIPVGHLRNPVHSKPPRF